MAAGTRAGKEKDLGEVFAEKEAKPQTMKSIITLVFLILGTGLFAQEEKVEYLKDRRAELNDQIEILKDSLKVIEKEILHLEQMREKAKKEVSEPIDEVEVSPNVGSLYAKKDLVLKDRPNKNGKDILEIKKGTRLLKIDDIGNYFLVCINGTCGYAAHSEVGKTEKKS